MENKNYKAALVFEAERSHYSIDQQEDAGAMTVGELISILEDYNEEDLIILSHDNGYTYGTLSAPEYYEKEDGGKWTWM